MTVSIDKANPITRAVRLTLDPAKGLDSLDVVQYADGSVWVTHHRAVWFETFHGERVTRERMTGTFDSVQELAVNMETGMGTFRNMTVLR
jgi:hypothetical protein